MQCIKMFFVALLCAFQLILSQNAAQAASSYDIRSGDSLAVNVYQQPELSITVRVGNDGKIRYPFVGIMDVIGKDLRDIETKISKRLAREGFLSPQVVVSVSKFAPRPIYVLGEVNSPDDMGVSAIPMGSEITAMQAVSLAGGVKASGDITKIVVRRTLPSGEMTLIPVPAQDVLMGKNVDDVVLEPNDTVVVPKALPISVLGTAKRPGQFYISPDVPMTVSMAISLAGGVDRPNSLSVLRVTRGNESFKVDIQDFLEDGKGGEDVLLQPGDILYVPETRW